MYSIVLQIAIAFGAETVDEFELVNSNAVRAEDSVFLTDATRDISNNLLSNAVSPASNTVQLNETESVGHESLTNLFEEAKSHCTENPRLVTNYQECAQSRPVVTYPTLETDYGGSRECLVPPRQQHQSVVYSPEPPCLYSTKQFYPQEQGYCPPRKPENQHFMKELAEVARKRIPCPVQQGQPRQPAQPVQLRQPVQQKQPGATQTSPCAPQNQPIPSQTPSTPPTSSPSPAPILPAVTTNNQPSSPSQDKSDSQQVPDSAASSTNGSTTSSNTSSSSSKSTSSSSSSKKQGKKNGTESVIENAFVAGVFVAVCLL